MNMTPEQKQIAIAEFEGWTLKSNGRTPMWSWQNPNVSHRLKWVCHKNLASKNVLPPYLTSRDAICGAVAKLDDMRFCYFVEHLERVCGTDGWEIMGSEDRRKVLLATPSQMADALLLTLGHEI